MASRAQLVGAVVLLGLLVWRTLVVVKRTHDPTLRPAPRSESEPASLAIFLGSGGHTAEMMRLLSSLPLSTRFVHRTYLIAADDTLSLSKALALEKSIGGGTFEVIHIPRARYVHQSFLTSPFTTLHSLAFCLWHVALAPVMRAANVEGGKRAFSDLVVLNGPGSCVPIAYSAFIPRIVGLPSAKLLYVESLARTQRLSLSGLLVRPIVDRFFVQWDGLRDKLVERGRGSRFRGLLAEVECEGWLV